MIPPAMTEVMKKISRWIQNVSENKEVVVADDAVISFLSTKTATGNSDVSLSGSN